MRGLSTELKVGFFTLGVLAILAFMTFKVGGVDWAKQKGYTLYAYFNNTAGLGEKTKVKVAGVDAGVVERIDLEHGKAKVVLSIVPGLVVHKDARAAIKSSGLLGDKYLDLTIGSASAPILKNGDVIENVGELIDVDDMARNLMEMSRRFSALTENLNEVFGSEEAKASLRATVVNLKELTSSLNRAVAVNDKKLQEVLTNLDRVTISVNDLIRDNRENITGSIADVRDFSARLKTDGPELVANLSKTANELRTLVEQAKPGVLKAADSLGTIADSVSKGEGTLGKLVKDDRLYNSVSQAAEGLNKTLSAVDRFRTYITFRTDYLFDSGEGVGSFSVTLQPSKEKYYLLGVVGDPVETVKTTETTDSPPGTTVTTTETKKQLKFDALFGRRFGDIGVRIGVKHSTFGVGGDFYFNEDRGRVFVDAWDFPGDEQYATNPHVKTGLEYFLMKNIFVRAGGDNLLNKKWRGFFAGAGVRFEDEDFKYLLGSLPRVTK